MFHITLTPQRLDTALTLSRKGRSLILNGAPLDLAALPEGASLPPEAVASPWIAGPISRSNGVFYLTLLLPVPALPHPVPAAARTLTHPEPIVVTADGPIALPSYTPEA